uniref:Rhodanese domain-containing protein n=1 Tax=Lotharella oceanica TaxID=641309 RepID=A0A7S2THY5_9EUKA
MQAPLSAALCTLQVVCAQGNDAKEACKILNEFGFANVSMVKGGFSAWTADGRPIASHHPDKLLHRRRGPGHPHDHSKNNTSRSSSASTAAAAQKNNAAGGDETPCARGGHYYQQRRQQRGRSGGAYSFVGLSTMISHSLGSLAALVGGAYSIKDPNM